MTSFTDDRVPMAVLAELDFANGPLRLWTGTVPLSWRGVEFSGAGELVGIGEFSFGLDQEATGYELTLSAVPLEIIGILENDRWKRRRAQLWIAIMNEQFSAIIGEPVSFLRGQMDTITYRRGPAAADFTLRVETQQLAQRRPRPRRYTDRDQQAAFPGDKAFEFVPSLKGRKIKWGTSE